MTTVYTGRIEDLQPGETSVIERTLTVDHIDRFADAIDSHHPIHMDSDWIDRETGWGPDRVVHGLMTAALVSRTIVNFLEDHGLKGCICYTASKLIAPVRAGDTIRITLRYEGVVPGKPRLRFTTEAVRQDGEVVMKGEIHEHIFLDEPSHAA